jgi:hypothetical protein
MNGLKSASLLAFAVLFALALPQRTVHAATVNEIMMLDHFETGTDRNAAGGTTQGDEEFPGGCIPEEVSDPALTFGGRGQSLKLDYDVEEPNSFSFYWTKAGPPDIEPGSSTPADLTPYKYLSFWIKSSEITPRFGIEIHQDTDGDKFFVLGKDVVAKIPANRFIVGEDAEHWRKVVLPLSSFRQIQDWSKILEIVFVFENKNRSKKGLLFVDDILFGSSELPEDEVIAPIEKKKIFGYFKINGSEVDGGNVRVSSRNEIELFLKTIPPDLESVRLELSTDGGNTWAILENFYEHKEGEPYRFQWAPGAALPSGRSELRAAVVNQYGQVTVVSGPFKIAG